MAVIRKKRETVWKAQLKAREEEEVKAQARREAEEKLLEEATERARVEAEASRRAQQEQDDAEFQGKSGNEKPNSDTELPAALSANAHPEEDGDYQLEDVMDVDEGASPKKGKEKVKAVIPPQLKKDAPRAARKEEPEPDYLLALVNINNSVASLARAVTASNIHPATIARYVEVMAGVGSDSDESGNESKELLSGDEEVSRGLKKVVVNTWLDDDWYLKQK